MDNRELEPAAFEVRWLDIEGNELERPMRPCMFKVFDKSLFVDEIQTSEPLVRVSYCEVAGVGEGAV